MSSKSPRTVPFLMLALTRAPFRFYSLFLMVMRQFKNSRKNSLHSLSPYPEWQSSAFFYSEIYNLTLHNTVLQVFFATLTCNLRFDKKCFIS